MTTIFKSLYFLKMGPNFADSVEVQLGRYKKYFKGVN